MDKKLPKVFANKIEKNFQNNDRVYVASKAPKEEEIDFKGMTVNQKIKAILNSRNYIYKANVEIKTNTGVIQTKIIGKSGNQLITMDRTLIPIDSIIDIQQKNS